MYEFVGIDVSKAKLDCLWLRDLESLRIKTKVITNSKTGVVATASWLTKTLKRSAEEIVVVMESTGIYHERLAYYLFEKGFRVIVVNPAKIKAFGASLGSTHKTDKQDSLVIARYGVMNHDQLWQPELPEIRVLKAYIARLEALDKDHQRELNRQEKAEITQVSDIILDSISNSIRYIEQEKKRLESEIDDHIDKHPRLKKDRALLQSIPGIGEVVSRVMLSVIHSRSFKSASELAAYLGLIPRQVQSGVFKGRSKLTKTGPSFVRAKLYMPAVAAGKCNEEIKRQKQRLLAAGKNKMQALGAAMRKLVHICFGVIKHQKEYIPQMP